MEKGQILKVLNGKEPQWFLDILADDENIEHTSYTRKWSIRLVDSIYYYISPRTHMGHTESYTVAAYGRDSAKAIIKIDIEEEARWEKFNDHAEDDATSYVEFDAYDEW